MANIWVAAGDGDLVRVQHLVETLGISPNAPDQHTYTPMHAAASYSHIHVLSYLISKGGDVNVSDHDGDTPLYAVEDIDTARFLLDNGASLQTRNNQGLSPIDHLSEDFPAVAAYLQTRLPPPSPSSNPYPLSTPPPLPSQHAQHLASDALTSELLDTVQTIMQRAEDTGTEPDDEALRAAVARSVLRGVAAGLEFSQQTTSSDENDNAHTGSTRPSHPDDNTNKRSRIDE